MSRKYTDDEIMARMGSVLNSSDGIIADYMDLMIDRLRESLEQVTEYKDIRFIQGQIAGIRDFCAVVKE